MVPEDGECRLPATDDVTEGAANLEPEVGRLFDPGAGMLDNPLGDAARDDDKSRGFCRVLFPGNKKNIYTY